MSRSGDVLVLPRAAAAQPRSAANLREFLSGGDAKLALATSPAPQLHEPIAVSSEDLEIFYHRCSTGGSPPLGAQPTLPFLRRETGKYVLGMRGFEGIAFDRSGISKDAKYFWTNLIRPGDLPPGIERQDDAMIISADLLRGAVEISEPLIVSYNGNAHNYYHLFESGVALDTVASHVGSDVRIFYPSGLDRHTTLDHRGFLANVGYDSSSLFEVEHPVILAKEIFWLENYAVEEVSAEILRRFRERMFTRLATRPAGRNRIYIRRTGSRSIANAAEVERTLEAIGFAVVDLELLSAAGQTRLFQDAELIVGPHGAGLVNIVFSPVGTAVVELVPSCEFRPFFWMIADKLDQRYGLLSCPSNAFNEPMQVDVRRLLELIDAVLGTARGTRREPPDGRPKRPRPEETLKMAVDRSDVEWSYRTLLNRAPESEEVIAYIIEHVGDLKELVQGMLASPEYRRLRGLSALLGEEIVVRRHSKYGFTFSVDLSAPSPPYQYIIFDYELTETDFIYNQLSPGQVCVDAGARHGWLTCVMAAKVGRGGKVYAFDPDRGTHPFLMSVLAENRFHHVAVLPLGLSDKSGRLNFRPGNATVRSDMPETGDYAVDVARLDDVLAGRAQPVSFLKLDIEGHEWPALQGAVEVLRQDRPTLLVELNEDISLSAGGYSAAAMIRWLTSDFDYQPIGWDGSEMPMAQVEAMISPGKVHNLALKPR